MELRHLRYFIAVAEELNFSRAAERLGINQPPLSLQIRQLEEELGVSLFNRGARGVELTDAGKLLLEEARAVLEKVEAAKTDVRRRARGETGEIVIGSATGTYFHPSVPAIVREYGRQYPNIIVAPQSSHAAALVARLHTGLIDVAFIWLPIGNTGELMLEPLADENTVVAVPARHPLSNSASVPLSALAKETFLQFPRALQPDAYDMIIAACHRAGFNPAFGQEAPDMVSSIPLVAAGLGVSIVPQSMSRILNDGVHYLPIEDAPRMKLCLVYRRDEPSPAVQNFAATAHRTIRTMAQARSRDDMIDTADADEPLR